MKKIYKKRLIKFAEHLETIDNHPEHGIFKTVIIYAYEGNVRIHVEVVCHHWVFDELVEVFPEEWGYSSKTGDAILECKEPDGETADCVFEFFGIEHYEVFCHLFDLHGYQQIEKWGGQKLNEDSLGPKVLKSTLASVKWV